MVKDQFNIDMIYPTKKNTVSWFMDNSDPEEDSRFKLGSDVESLIKTGNYWKCERNDKVRLSAATPKAVNMNNSEGGCDMRYDIAEQKGHAGMTDAWTNVEMTMLVNLSTFSPSDSRISMKGPSFEHTNPQPCCSGHAYTVWWYFGNPLVVQFAKEMWHSHGAPNRPKVTTAFASIADGNDHILKFVTYVKLINNVKARILEAYIDYDADGSNFVKVNETIDNGGWGTGGDDCNGDPDQIFTWGSGLMTYRWDMTNTNIKFKSWSVREIDTSTTIEVDPVDPEDTRGSETQLVVPLALPFHVNAYLENPCMISGGGGGGGGGGSPTPIYEVGLSGVSNKELTDNAAFGNVTNSAVKVEGTGSPVYNEIVKTFKPYLAKVNSPSSQNVTAHIWNNANTLVYTSPTVIADSALPTSLTLQTFSFSTNTRATQVGDKIGVQYLGTSGSNYVIYGRVANISGNDTTQATKEAGVWEDNSREMCCEVFNV